MDASPTPIALATIAQALAPHGVRLQGDAHYCIRRIAAFDTATPDAITFLSNPRYAARLPHCQAGCIILGDAVLQHSTRPGNYLVADNPYAAYAHITQWWRRHTLACDAQPHIHPSAVVHPTAQVDASATIGPLCVVERGARIGAGSWLKSRVTIGEHCTVGDRCILHAGVVIGADGFGFANDGGDWVKIEQLGAVRIGNDVEIGANTCIDRGAIDDTVVEDGVKLDNLIQIAHNVHLGRRVAIAANTGIAGSTTVADGVTIGGGANIMGHIQLGQGVHVSATTFISRSVTQPGTYSGHFPFDDNASWEKNAATVRQLYKMRERLRAIEKTLQTLAPQPDTPPHSTKNTHA